jgi:methyltransferase (TIGR00027 family)
MRRMAQAAAQTGIMPTFLVAVEQSFPPQQRIVNDDMAIRMLPFAAAQLVRLLRLRWPRDGLIALVEKSDPGIWGGLLCRKRYIDDKLRSARDEIDCVLSLGAGFDTRPFRLPELSRLPAWEIDQRGNIEEKIRRLRQALPSIPEHLKLIAADFDHDPLGAVLAAAGYSTTARTFIIWEGVTQYLSEPGVRASFEWLAQAAPGSRLAFTYVRKGFLDGRTLYGWAGGHRRFVASGIWQFGMEPEMWPAFLGHYGWRLVEDIGYDQLAARYIAPTGRRLSLTPVERLIYAERT